MMDLAEKLSKQVEDQLLDAWCKISGPNKCTLWKKEWNNVIL